MKGRAQQMLIYAHRGASGEFPEGTEAAYLEPFHKQLMDLSAMCG